MGIKTKRIDADRNVNELAARFVKNEGYSATDSTTFIAVGEIVAITGISGGFVTVSRADANGAAKTRTNLWVVKTELREYGEVTRWAEVDMDTSGGAVGDLVYLSDTAGALSLTAGTNTVVVGKVLSAATAGKVEIDTAGTASAEGGLVDLNGLADGLVLDADADTTISAPTDDQIDFEVSGADDFRMTANTFTALSGSTIATDTIAETTAAAGVTIDSLLIKDGKVDLNGVAGALILDADADTFVGASTDDQIDITVSGAIDFQITANTLTAVSGSTIATNTIAETTAAAGVTVDGLRIKDAAVTPVAGGAAFIDVSGCATGEADIVVADNLASALEIREAANVYATVVTTNDLERIDVKKILAVPEVTVIDMADAAHALVLGTAGAAQTKLVGNIVLCDANSTGTEALTLPAAASCDGLWIIIVNTGGEDITMADVLTGLTLSTTEVALVVSNGTAWYGGVMKLT